MTDKPKNPSSDPVDDTSVPGYAGALDQLTGDKSTYVGRGEDGALHILTKSGELTDEVVSDPDPAKADAK